MNTTAVSIQSAIARLSSNFVKTLRYARLTAQKNTRDKWFTLLLDMAFFLLTVIYIVKIANIFYKQGINQGINHREDT